MRLLILNYEFPPLGGGAGRGSYNIAKQLAAQGHSVDVITSRAKGQPAKEVVDGFTIYRVVSWRKGVHDCGFRGAFTYLLFAIPVFRRLVRERNYDILHYFFSLPTGLLHCLPGAHRKIPYIVSLRGSDVPEYDVFNKPLMLAHNLVKPVTRYIWNKAARVVALSSDLRNTAKRTAPEMDIAVIPNGIESELFLPEKTETEVRQSDTIQMICVSRLIERKGIQHVLQALTRIELPVHLTIVGEGNYQDQLKEQAKALGVNDRVTFYGYCAREELVALYANSDFFILPSMAESFGMVFVEAMSCELPVIGARIGGVPDIVAEENGILVEAANVDEIQQAIETMASDADMRAAMATANRQKVIDHYTWQSVADQYNATYQAALEKH
jgi:glycosyltransferase involved in cell wall biosynthesis